MKQTAFLFLAVIAPTTYVAPAHAQIATQATQPNRLDATSLGIRRHTTDPLISPPASSHAELLASGPGEKVSRVRIEGSSLPKATLDKAMQPFAGAVLDAARLRAIADAVSAAYGRSNVALYSVLVPEQDFRNGVVRIVTIENHIDEVYLSGKDVKKASVTRTYAKEMAAERPLTRTTLERSLLLMNDLPGVKVAPRVLQGESLDSVKLALDHSQAPVETVLTLDTRGAAQLGRVQLQGDVEFNGVGYEGNQIRLSASSSSDFHKFLSVSAADTATVGPSGVSVTASGGYFRTRPDAPYLQGDGTAFGLQGLFPVIRSVKTNVSLQAAFDGVNSNNALFGQVMSRDRTRALRAGVSASGQWRKTSWATSGSISQGLTAFGARVSDPTSAGTRYTKGDVEAAVSQSIGKTWRVDARTAVQISRDALPAAELWQLGGSTFGRAFDNGAISGDSGVATSLELAHTLGAAPGPLKNSEIYLFGDYGKIWVQDRPAPMLNTYDLASAGAGIRIRANKNTVLDLEAANAVDVIDETRDNHVWRGAVSLRSGF